MSVLLVARAMMPILVIFMTIIPLYDKPTLLSPGLVVGMTAWTFWYR